MGRRNGRRLASLNRSGKSQAEDSGQQECYQRPRGRRRDAHGCMLKGGTKGRNSFYSRMTSRSTARTRANTRPRRAVKLWRRGNQGRKLGAAAAAPPPPPLTLEAPAPALAASVPCD